MDHTGEPLNGRCNGYSCTAWYIGAFQSQYLCRNPHMGAAQHLPPDPGPRTLMLTLTLQHTPLSTAALDVNHLQHEYTHSHCHYWLSIQLLPVTVL